MWRLFDFTVFQFGRERAHKKGRQDFLGGSVRPKVVNDKQGRKYPTETLVRIVKAALAEQLCPHVHGFKVGADHDFKSIYDSFNDDFVVTVA